MLSRLRPTLTNIIGGYIHHNGITIRMSSSTTSFKKVGSTFVEHKIPLTLYRSTTTGAKIVIVDHPSAMVNSEISFATAHENDAGLAHTLEHLVFIGSKKYPYAEFLTNLAERSYGYINAFTSFDNTAYQIKTVGPDGFIKLLPVYLDNLLNPLLTESSYITEVHHINGKGQDGGVVYSEMKGREFREVIRLNQLIYGKESPLGYNLGGDPKAIRESCTLEKIRAYHKKYYRMENIFINVVGTINHEQVLQTVEKFQQENNFVKNNDFKRTYIDFNLPPIKKTVERILIPAEGNHGTVIICWKGPDIWGSEIFPISQLLKYLSSGPESPLYKHYVNSSPPICSTICAKGDKHKISVIGFEFHGTNEEYLPEDKEHIFQQDLLKLINEHEIDLNRMHDILKHDIEQIGRFLESDVSSSVFSDIRNYQNYAPNVSTENDEIKHLATCHIEEIEKALTYDENYWKDLVKKYITNDYIVLYALPSKELIEKEKQEEDERIKKQIEKLGEEGLKKCEEKLEKAVNENKSLEASQELLNEYTVKDINDIALIPVERNKKTDGYLEVPKIIHKTGSNFVNFKLIFDGKTLPKEYYPLLKLYLNVITHSSAMINGKTYTCEELSAKRKSEILNFKLGISMNLLKIEATSVLKNIEKISYWMDVYLNKLFFEKDVIERVLKKLITYAEEYKRHDNALVSVLDRSLTELPQAIDYYFGELELQNYHKELLSNINDELFVKKLIEKLNEIKKHITNLDMNLHLIGNIDGIENIQYDKWPKLIGKTNIVNRPNEVDDFSLSIGKSLCIARPECTSAYMHQAVKASFKAKSKELVYSNLLNLYFCESSGLLHTEIRGKGYAYHVGLTTSRELGIRLKIYDASNLCGAYELSKKLVNDTIKSGKLDKEIFEIAKRGLIMRYVNSENTVAQAGENSFNDYMKGYNIDENSHQLAIKIINSATPEDVLNLVGKHYLELFDDSKVSRAMIVPQSTTDVVKETFNNVEFKTVEDLSKDISVDFVDSVTSKI